MGQEASTPDASADAASGAPEDASSRSSLGAGGSPARPRGLQLSLPAPTVARLLAVCSSESEFLAAANTQPVPPSFRFDMSSTEGSGFAREVRSRAPRVDAVVAASLASFADTSAVWRQLAWLALQIAGAASIEALWIQLSNSRTPVSESGGEGSGVASSSSSSSSSSSTLAAAAAEEVVEEHLLTLEEAFVYKIGKGQVVASGFVAESWGLDKPFATARLRVASRGEAVSAQLWVPRDPARPGIDESLLANCVMEPHPDVDHPASKLEWWAEPVVDSSRYFVLRILGRAKEEARAPGSMPTSTSTSASASGPVPGTEGAVGAEEDRWAKLLARPQMRLGVGFRDRSAATHFRTVLLDHFSFVARHRRGLRFDSDGDSSSKTAAVVDADGLASKEAAAGGGGGGGGVGGGVEGAVSTALQLTSPLRLHLPTTASSSVSSSSAPAGPGVLPSTGSLRRLAPPPPPPSSSTSVPVVSAATTTAEEAGVASKAATTATKSVPSDAAATEAADEDDEDDWGEFASGT